MNRARFVRLFVFACSTLMLLFYPLYVRNYLLESLPFVGASALPEVFRQQVAMNTVVIFGSLIMILFPISIGLIFWLGRFGIGERLFFRRNQVDPNSRTNFHLDKWYDSTRRFLGNDWFVQMFNALDGAMLFTGKSGITFVSPAANKGVYEKHLYDYLKQKGLDVKCIIADIDAIENHAVQGIVDENLRYLPGKEALKIGAYVSEINESGVDVIFDIKGSLWYSFRSDADQTVLLETFYTVLNAGGLIVIDNSKRRFLSFCIYYLFGNVSWYVETSTGCLLNRKKKKDRNFRAYVDSRFEQMELDFQNEFGDVFDILVLRKR